MTRLPIPNAALLLASVAGLLLCGCAYTIEEKPGSAELLKGDVLYRVGETKRALETVEAGLVRAADPEIAARLHYQKGRLFAIEQGDPQTAMRELAAARRLGYAPATRLMAEMHADGSLGEPDPAAAIALYREIYAEDPRAALGLARLLHEAGGGTAPDAMVRQLVRGAITALERDAAAGRTSAARSLAGLYADGKLAPRDDAKVAQYLSSAIKAGDEAALVDLASVWLGAGLDSQAQRARLLLEDAGGRGSRPAMVELGRAFRNGAFGAPDPAASARWYGMAQDAGEPGLEFALASLLLESGDDPARLAKAVGMFERAVAQGDARAAVVLGRLYAAGRGGPPQPERAFALFQQAALAGQPDGAMELGRAYAAGVGAPANPTEAVAAWSRAVRLGSRGAHKELGQAYADGFGVPVDFVRASEHLEIAAADGSVTAAMRLAELHEKGVGEGPNLPLAAEWYKTAADRGSVMAASNLAALHERGLRGTPDYAAAARWHERAADQGSLPDMRRLAELYGDTRLPLAEPRLAVLWLRRAAEAGDVSSMLELAKAYGAGRGEPPAKGEVERWLSLYARAAPGAAGKIAYGYESGAFGPPSLSKALPWYVRAADGGDARAMRWLADAYASGTALPRNGRTAAIWRMRAARAGDVVAMRRVGQDLLASGQPAATAQGINFLRRAARQGDAAAMHELADAITSRSADAAALAEAADWYRSAASAGRPEAQYQIGMMYMQGLGVERAPARARSWLEAARKNGVGMAEAALAALKVLEQ